MKKLAFLLACCVACSFAGPLAVAAAPAGATWVPVSDDGGTPLCIDQTKDEMSITLRQIILEKGSKYFGVINDNKLTLPMTIHVEGASGSNPSASADFAKTASEDIAQYATGKLSLPDEEDLLTAYPLTNPNGDAKGNDQIRRIAMEVRIIRTQGASQAATILADSASSLKNVNLPVLPFGPAFSVASSLVTGVFKDIEDKASGDTIAIAQKVFNIGLSENGCKGDDAQTGSFALLLAAGDPAKTGVANDPVYVDVTTTGTKCFANDYKENGYQLLVAPKASGASCASVTSGYKPIENSYLLFIVDAREKSTATSLVQPAVSADIRSLMAGLQEKPSSYVDQQSTLAMTLSKRGVPPLVAGDFARATNSTINPRRVASAFKTTPRSVQLYRQSLKRCAEYHLSAKTCAARF